MLRNAAGVLSFLEKRGEMQAGRCRRRQMEKPANGEDVELLLRTNNPVVISFVEALLSEADIDYLILDQYMSIVEGSLGVIPRRILVDGAAIAHARRVLAEADLAHELEPEA